MGSTEKVKKVMRNVCFLYAAHLEVNDVVEDRKRMSKDWHITTKAKICVSEPAGHQLHVLEMNYDNMNNEEEGAEFLFYTAI